VSHDHFRSILGAGAIFLLCFKLFLHGFSESQADFFKHIEIKFFLNVKIIAFGQWVHEL
jgi:hypothetical protein